jgi:predicted metal-dependent phosphoesterase TrpH
MPDYDLHVHTTRSDGTLTPSEVASLAAERELEGIAITDHDTFAGLDEMATAAAVASIDLIPGIEFSAEFDGASLHILGYWVDPTNEAVREELRRLTDTRFRRGELMVEKLRELGYELSFERVREIAGGETIARPHVATAMVQAGIVATEKEAFERFISDDGIAYVPKHALAPLAALTLIRAAGGACVLAHPGMWKGQGAVPDELIEQMAAAGMAGLEVDHPDHDPDQRAKYRNEAGRLGLVPTGASDCHGERYGTRLGCDRTPRELVEELRRRAGERSPA